MRAASILFTSASLLLSFAHAADEGESGGLPQLNPDSYASQVFWLVVTFLILYFLCAKIFLPRLGGIIEERRNRIADDFDQAAEFKTQAEEAEATFNKALADARAKAAQIGAETREQLDAEIAEMQAETEQSLEADIVAAEKRIAETAAAANAAVQEAATDTTKALVAALIDETPSEDAVANALSRASA